MFFKIISSSILRQKNSKALAFLTIFCSVTLISCMLNITLNIGDQVANELRSYGSNIVVLPKSQNLSITIGSSEFLPLKNEDYLKESDLHKIKEIFWRNNITAFAPFLSLKMDDFDIVGTYFDKDIDISDEPGFKSGVVSLYPFWRVEGKYPKDDSMSEILAGDGLGLSLGDILSLAGMKVKVVGILHSSESESKKLIVSLKLAQSLANRPNLIDKAEVSAMSIPENDLSLKARRDLDSLDSVAYDKWYCSAYVSSIAYQISEEYPNATAKAVLSVSQTQSEITKKIQSLMAIASVLSLIISSMCITSLMISEINRRKKEIGLLKALGATNFIIYLQFVAEIFVVCFFASLVGSLAGYALSFALSYQVFGSFVGISIIVLPLSVFFGFLISILGSILPLKSVVNLVIAEVLYGRK